MKKITLLVIFMITSLGFSQQQEYLFDFEADGPDGTASNWLTFDNDPAAAEIVDNPDLDGVNATASKVLKVVMGPGNAFYAGVNNAWEQSAFGTWKIDMAVPSNLTLSMDVNKNYVGTVGIKMGTNTGGTSFQITDQNVGNTVVDEWQTLTFDLSGINPNGDLTNISQMVIFVDWTQDMPDRAEGSTIYIDNVKFNAEKLTDAPAAPVAGSASLPLDFESATTWVDFDGGAVTTETNPHNNGDNSSANVGKMVKNAGQTWGGSSITMASGMDFANNDTFTMKVYSPRVGAKVLLKVENSADSGTAFEKEVETTVANAWETLTFDYTAISKTSVFDKLVLIFDNGTEGDGSANYTFYIDDIALSSSGVVVPTVALPVDFESATTWVDFDGGAVTTETNPHNNGDNSSANVGKMVKSVGQTWGGSSLLLSSGMDFANNDIFTMKVYSPRAGAKVLLKVENSGNAGTFFEKEVETTVANAWETLTFDYAAISKTNIYDKLVIIFDNGTMGDASANFTFYIDDITLTTTGVTVPTVNLPLDFESATTWGDFDGGVVTTETNPHNNGDNSSANVGKMVKNAGQTWGGSSIVLGAAMDFANNDTFTMKVYSPRVGAKVLLKVEDSGNGATFFEKEVETTVANAWETLTFDYAAISKTNTYDKLVIIFDNGTMGDGSANFTFYIDDIALSSSGAVVPTVNLPLDFESATTWGDFDGGAVSTESNPHSNANNSSANVGKMVKHAGQVWGGSSIIMGAAMDFANNDTFSMKVFSPRVGAKVLLKVEDSGNGATFFEKEVATTVANEWETLTFDYAAINSANSYDKLVIIFDNGTMGDGSADFTFYMDDIMLFNAATASVLDNDLLSVKMYPNPTVNTLTISAAENIKTAQIFNVLGKKVMSLNINKTSESIDVSNLASGIYLIRYNINNATGTAKFIKQ